jgi:hypothetical protein
MKLGPVNKNWIDIVKMVDTGLKTLDGKVSLDSKYVRF